MQKKLIALAVAGMIAAPAAMAQSNVTVYGVVDTYMGTFGGKQLNGATGQMSSGRVNAVNAGGLSGSRLGFRGTEDLGNGLSAIFTLEYSIENDINAGVGNTGTGLEARQQFLGLRGGFGTVVAGRLMTPGFGFAAKYDVTGGSGLASNALLTGLQGATIHAGGNGRQNNAIGYASPNMNGFTVNAAYVFGEQDDVRAAAGTTRAAKNERTSVMGLAVDYSNGPLSVGAVYHKLNGLATARNYSAAAVSDSDGQREWAVGAMYDFGVIRPIVRYQNLKADSNVVGVRDYSAKIWSVGAVVPVSEAGNVHVSYSRLTGTDANATVDNKMDSWTLFYTHGLSARTTLYTGYTHLKADDGALFTAARNANASGAATFGGLQVHSNQSYNGMVLGLRHSF